MRAQIWPFTRMLAVVHPQGLGQGKLLPALGALERLLPRVRPLVLPQGSSRGVPLAAELALVGLDLVMSPQMDDEVVLHTET